MAISYWFHPPELAVICIQNWWHLISMWPGWWPWSPGPALWGPIWTLRPSVETTASLISNEFGGHSILCRILNSYVQENPMSCALGVESGLWDKLRDPALNGCLPHSPKRILTLDKMCRKASHRRQCEDISYHRIVEWTNTVILSSDLNSREEVDPVWSFVC